MPGAGLRSVLVGTLGLDLAAAAALWLTVSRGPARGTGQQIRRTIAVATLALLAQAAHFGEEYLTDFGTRFPVRLGLAAWPQAFFVDFNLLWLAVWVFAIVGLKARLRITMFPLWFLAIASVANGIVHPLLAVAGGGYFPGLVTSPLVLVAGVILFRRLIDVSQHQDARQL